MSFIKDNRKFILNAYETENKSPGIIAKELNTYTNKIRRALLSYGKELRGKSEAQKIALESGRSEHPTKGKKRSEETKIKISENLAEYWDQIPDEEYQKRVDKCKENWNNMTEEQKSDFHAASIKSIREAAVKGSKLERFVKEFLEDNKYNVLFHKKGLIYNNNLEVDMFIAGLNVAIEIDGPSHFFPIWGQESLDRQIKSDAEKNGLLISAGYKVLRVKHMVSNVTEKHKRDVSKAVLDHLQKLEEGKKTRNLFELEVK
jgi:very-short-patch-repair endonuclease